MTMIDAVRNMQERKTGKGKSPDTDLLMPGIFAAGLIMPP
jgi:hypothetical protein